MADNNIFEFNMKNHSLNDVWVHIPKLLQDNKQARILIINCGVGYLVKYLKDQGFTNIKGIDPRIELIEKGIELCPNLKGSIYTANFFREVQRKHDYDLYVFVKVLEYQNNASHFLEVLPSGANILLTYPNYDDGLTLQHFQSKGDVEDYLKPVMEVKLNTSVSLFKNAEFMIDQALFLILGQRL